MTEDRKELLLNRYAEYEALAEKIESEAIDKRYDTINYKGRRLDLISILIKLDAIAESKEVKEDIKEEKPTTKKK